MVKREGEKVNRGHKKLDVWSESIALATHIYQITEKFPKAEIYGLTSQMRRAAVSIPSNIAEGAARASSKEFNHVSLYCLAAHSASWTHKSK